MRAFLRSWTKFIALLILVCTLGSCSPSGTAGLEPFQSNNGRYGFFYPTGWTRISVQGGPEVVFHDLINSDETLSLVVSDVGEDVSLEKIGTEF